MLGKGRSIVPHGHNNMATAFDVLKGEFHGRHFERVEDMVIEPTIDRKFGPAEASTISDYKDNEPLRCGRSDPSNFLIGSDGRIAWRALGCDETALRTALENVVKAK